MLFLCLQYLTAPAKLEQELVTQGSCSTIHMGVGLGAFGNGFFIPLQRLFFAVAEHDVVDDGIIPHIGSRQAAVLHQLLILQNTAEKILRVLGLFI